MMRLRVFGRLGRSLHFGAGAIVAAMGVAILTGELTSLSYWLLDTFPFLSSQGSGEPRL
jgi:cytochrome c-type biogenesis protein